MSVNNQYSNIRVAIVGCGNWGKNLVRVFHELGALYAVCDIESSRAQTFANQYNVPALSFEEILHSSTIDAVIIATPSFTHKSLAHLSLKANKHVFIEKPMALRAKEAILLSQYAQSQMRILMVGHLIQYHPAFEVLKDLCAQGVLGNIHYIYSHRLNFGKFPGEPNVLWDFAPHDVSIILALFGETPSQVSASGSNALQHTTLDTTCFQLYFKGNKQAHVFCSWLHPVKEHKLTVIGDKAMAIFNDGEPENKLKLFRIPENCTDGLPHPFTLPAENISLPHAEPLLNECEHFLNAILNRTEPRTNGVEGSHVISVLETVAQAIEAQLTLPVKISQRNEQSKITSFVSEVELEENY
ncbi:MAG: Gfo/Idh/MocA family protein [Candidatus Berkiellales bacterium]